MNAVILLVDDEPRVLDGLRRDLFEEPYEVITAGGGAEALEVLGSRHVDVVISDEKMPGMSGATLLTQICRDYPDTVRIMLTGQATLEAAMTAINDGEVYRFLNKPCGRMELTLALQEALEFKDLRTAAFRLLRLSERQAKLLSVIEEMHPGSVAQADAAMPADTETDEGAVTPALLAARMRVALERLSRG